MNKQYITTSIEKVLEMHDKDYDTYQIEKLIDRWYAKKEPLINILRNHPNWNEEQMAIILSTESSRPLNRDVAYNECANIHYKYFKCFGKDLDYTIHNLINAIISEEGNLISSEYKESIKEYIPKFREGTKTTRILHKLYEIAFEKIPESITEVSEEEFMNFFNKAWARLADSLNPITVTQWTVLSVNPCDYLHMSHGNSWESCHNINDGCYMAGTLSYMCDPSSMIFCTVDGNFNGDEYWREKKITRQVYSYENGMLLQSRLYPNSSDTSTIKNNRQIVQMVMSEVLGVSNLWTLKEDNICRHISTEAYSHHYRDYEHSEYRSTVSILKDNENTEKYIHIGSLAYCLMCGETIDQHDYLYCNRCKDGEDYVYCEDCGKRIHIDDARLIDGYYYCEDCCDWCDCCEKYVREELHYISGYGDVCQDCLDDSGSFFYCECCDEYYYKRKHVSYETQDGVTICEDCFESYYFICNKCGEIIYENDAQIIGEDWYCKDCYEEMMEETNENESEEVA